MSNQPNPTARLIIEALEAPKKALDWYYRQYAVALIREQAAEIEGMREWLVVRLNSLESEYQMIEKEYRQHGSVRKLDKMLSIGSKAKAYKEVINYHRDHTGA